MIGLPTSTDCLQQKCLLRQSTCHTIFLILQLSREVNLAFVETKYGPSSETPIKRCNTWLFGQRDFSAARLRRRRFWPKRIFSCCEQDNVMGEKMRDCKQISHNSKKLWDCLSNTLRDFGTSWTRILEKKVSWRRHITVFKKHATFVMLTTL